MKSQLLLATAVAAFAVSGCTSRHSTTPWSENCIKHYSTNDREYRECMDRVAARREFSSEAGKVGVNPKAVDYPDFDGSANERGSGTETD